MFLLRWCQIEPAVPLLSQLPSPLLSFAVAGLLEQTIRLHKLVEDLSPDLSGAYLFEELADLILALLRTATPKQSVPVRCSKKRLPDRKRLPGKKLRSTP